MTNATWKRHPGSADFNTGTNWTGAAVPSGTAFFAVSGTTDLTFSAATDIGGWTFKAGASHYTFKTTSDHLYFTGTGIVIKGGSASIDNDDDLEFYNQSTAGSARFNNQFALFFNDQSTAGSARINNQFGLNFNDQSTAGSAHINNQFALNFNNQSTAGTAHINNQFSLGFNNQSTASSAHITNTVTMFFIDSSSAARAHIINGSHLDFFDTSKASRAHITNNASLVFHESSTAGNANIVNNFFFFFFDQGDAGHAHITNNGTTYFEGQSGAGNAVVTTTNGHSVLFEVNSDGDNARLNALTGGTIDVSQSNGPGDSHHISAGSIQGAGHYILGANQFYVGSNNSSTKVSGAIDGASGSALHKVGTGTLTLSHAGNSYVGTVITQGTLDVAAQGAAGTELDFDAGRQTLKIENAALVAHSFGTVVSFIGAGDAIDLAGLKFVERAKATYDDTTHILTVKSGHVTDTLTLNDPATLKFKAVDDGHGLTKVVPVFPQAKVAAQSASGTQVSTHHTTADDAAAGATAANSDSFHFESLAGIAAPAADDDFHLGLGTTNLAFDLQPESFLGTVSHDASPHIVGHGLAHAMHTDFIL